MSDKGIIVIYNTESNGTKVEVKLIDGNLWLTQEQLVSLYNSSKSNISEHIKHILEEGELDENSVVRNFRTTASDGKQYNVKHYNLDMILAIGYRVRSNIGSKTTGEVTLCQEATSKRGNRLSRLPLEKPKRKRACA